MVKLSVSATTVVAVAVLQQWWKSTLVVEALMVSLLGRAVYLCGVVVMCGSSNNGDDGPLSWTRLWCPNTNLFLKFNQCIHRLNLRQRFARLYFLVPLVLNVVFYQFIDLKGITEKTLFLGTKSSVMPLV